MKLTSTIKNILTIAVLFIGSYCMAQPYAETPYKYVIEAAEESMAHNDYYNALEWYKKAYKESKDKDIYAKIGNLHYILRDYKKATKTFDRLLRKDKDSLYQAHRITYAKSLRGTGDYVEALNQYEVFLASIDESDEDWNEATRDLQGIKDMNSYNDNVDAIIHFPESGINSAFTEYGPAEYVDGSLYFSSFQRKKVIVLDGDEKDFESRIYVSSKDSEGNYGAPEVLSNVINREDYHSGNVCFSNDGRRMYFVRTLLDRNNIIESNLYISYRKDDQWSAPTLLEGINVDHFVRHPSVGELYGNEVLFFSSNIAGGHGGYDIYYSTITQDETFSTPINLGESINTDKDEFTPFYKEGQLYYSSDGRIGMGGLDIYHTTWDGSNWSEVINMGHGYNSPNDDFFFNLSPKSNNGSLVSNRPNEKKKKLKSETCCDDIYLFEIKDIVIDLIAKVDGDEGPLNAATAILIDLSAPEDEAYNSKQNPTANNFSFALEGDHNYMLKFKHADYTSDSIFFNTSGIYDDFTVEKTITLDRKPIIPEVEILRINEAIRLNNIYYDFNDATILREAEKDLSSLVRLMNEYPEIEIELGSHTDSQGKDSYNQKLSQRRAESARRWMLTKGIASNRITAKGYGEKHILNHCVNGVKCPDDLHRINRRTEFKITKGPEVIVITKEVKKTPKKKTITKVPTKKENKSDNKVNNANEVNKDSKKDKNNIDTQTKKKEKPKKKKRRVVKKKKKRKVKSRFKKNRKKSGKQSFGEYQGFPIIQFEQQIIDLGNVKPGENIPVTFTFTNTGDEDLLIEHVTTCKCTDIEWTTKTIAPGERGMIKALFHTDGYSGEVNKTIDIIANTNPIVVEAFFKVFIGE